MSLKVTDQITLKILDLAFGGEGVGRVDDFVVFVPFVIVGETVVAEITEVKKQFARAKLVQVLEASAERVTPECRYFTHCGGCQYQHLAYPAQLRMKQKQIVDLFERVGKIPPELVAPVLPCPAPYGYRNRIMIRSQWNGPARKLVIGFIRADNLFVEDIEECKIAEPALNEQIRLVRANPPPHGGLKVVLRAQPEGWEVPRDSFFQNNFFLLPKLVETVRGFLQTGGARHLIDLYCGVGFFGIEAADLVESFAGVEYDQSAIAAARKNAERRKLANGTFIADKAETALPALLREHAPAQTAVLLDPPRKGCWPELLELLRQSKPAQVIYVSCHPATMARDLNILRAGAVFELVRVQPLDMFPQTQHIECVADLRCQNDAHS
ncbi:MAG TPA: class I SAM-dependent RNA methyltransferase [Candidatus Acidoferrales bacterium]|nr:class I SAM-dependent RNA methyltransferase [Candidatus Acidoferrales bacterium]